MSGWECDGGCGEEGTDLHECPFMTDVHGDLEFECNCCEDCEQCCCDDI